MKFHTQLKANDIFKFSLAYTYSGQWEYTCVLQEWVQQMDSLI